MNQSDVVKPGRFALSAIASGVVLAFGSLGSTAAVAQDDDEATDLGTLKITGSRLNRSDFEGALPVTVITREEIDGAGEITVSDFLRNLTFNSFGSYRESSGNSFQGQALVSLRGLGSQRTLILLNGRRMPPSPVTQGGGIDLNTIPISAVERIELLSDGASAVYGSDAIGGVINVILKKDYSGTQAQFGIGRPTRDGADEASAYITTGVTSGKTSLIFGASHYDRDIIFDRDRDYSSVDLGDGQNFSTTSGISLFGNSFLRLDNYEFEPGPNCVESLELRPYTEDAFGLGGTLCTFAFGNVSANITSLDRDSVFVNGSHRITDDHNLVVNTIFTKSTSFGRYAPVPDSIFIDTTSPNNSFGVDGYLYHRFQALGNRDNRNSSYLFSTLLGVEGSFPFAANMTYDVGVRFSRYNFDEFGNNYLLRSVAREFLADGTYDPYNPFNNSDNVLNQMRITITREAEYRYYEYYGNLAFDLFNMPGGTAGLSVGAEYRVDDFFDQYDSQSEAGSVGGSAGASAAGGRTAYALYTETVLPILESLEAQIALRYDEYSIGGDAVSPKIGLRFQPMDMMTLRASWGQGFRVPTFSDLFASPAFSAEFARDFVACDANGVPDAQCPLAQFNTTINSNPLLEPEESDQFSMGIVVAPTDWFDTSLDYYSIQLENSISGFSVQELINIERAGQPLPAGTAIDRRSNGSLRSTTTGTFNIAKIDTSGLDLASNFRFDFGDLGSLSTKMRLSWVLQFEDSSLASGFDQVGAGSVPEYRATLTNDWKMGPFSAVWDINHVADTVAVTILVPNDTRTQGHVASATYHDFQFNYTAPWKSRFTLGVRNAFDRDPSLNPNVSGNFDDGLYDPYGRVPYFRFTQDF